MSLMTSIFLGGPCDGIKAVPRDAREWHFATRHNLNFGLKAIWKAQSDSVKYEVYVRTGPRVFIHTSELFT